jgi:ubiquinone/menaquinone biosynthesis C-methylase UbiE
MAHTEEEQILYNVQVHDAIAGQYEDVHREIFNTYEQARVAAAVRRVVGYLGHGPAAPRALDVGCGSGNVTSRLLEAGCIVTAADVARNFLMLCETKFASTGRLRTVLLGGDGLQELPDGAFDVVSAYSVLHHVPDYLRLVAEMVRVLAPGGVLYVDHESSERVYRADGVYQEFAALAGKSRSALKQFLTRTQSRRRVVHFLRGVLRPGFHTEGDIHVWPDDHVEFARIRAVLEARGCPVIEDQEYLLHPEGIAPAVYEAFSTRCADMRLLVARKNR